MLIVADDLLLMFNRNQYMASLTPGSAVSCLPPGINNTVRSCGALHVISCKQPGFSGTLYPCGRVQMPLMNAACVVISASRQGFVKPYTLVKGPHAVLDAACAAMI